MATEAGMAGRINTIMQTCFFAISGVLPRDEAIAKIKDAIQATYGTQRRTNSSSRISPPSIGRCEHLYEVPLPAAVRAGASDRPSSRPTPRCSCRQVTAMMMAGRGDELPVSALPADGTYPSGTARWEKRNISDRARMAAGDLHPVRKLRDGVSACDHSRRATTTSRRWRGAPEGFASAPLAGRGFPNLRFTLQVAVEDCTGCELCVEVCPAKSLEAAGTRAINMTRRRRSSSANAKNLAFFETLPENARQGVDARSCGARST